MIGHHLPRFLLRSVFRRIESWVISRALISLSLFLSVSLSRLGPFRICLVGGERRSKLI